MPLPLWLGPLVSAGRMLGRGLVQLLFPNHCWMCGELMGEERSGFCEPCQHALTSDTYWQCSRCGATVGPYIDSSGGCGNCRSESFAFDGVVRLGSYQGLLRDAVLRLKNWTQEGLAERLGQLWAEQAAEKIRSLGIDVVIPVPLHWVRHLKRGYNQSRALARTLSAALGLVCRPRWLRRVRATPSQTSQALPSQRRSNVRNAFTAAPGLNLEGKNVLLVDDVMTTGSTAHEAARALRAAGPKHIHVAVLARASH